MSRKALLSRMESLVGWRASLRPGMYTRTVQTAGTVVRYAVMRDEGAAAGLRGGLRIISRRCTTGIFLSANSARGRPVGPCLPGRLTIMACASLSFAGDDERGRARHAVVSGQSAMGETRDLCCSRSTCHGTCSRSTVV